MSSHSKPSLKQPLLGGWCTRSLHAGVFKELGKNTQVMNARSEQLQMRKLRHWMVTLYLLPLTSKWYLNPYPNSSSSQRERPGLPPLGLIPKHAPTSLRLTKPCHNPLKETEAEATTDTVVMSPCQGHPVLGHLFQAFPNTAYLKQTGQYESFWTQQR